MKYDEIIKLLDAGYTREEILEMKEEPNVETGMTDLVKEMRDAFAEMKKEFTAFNIMASRQPDEKTPEDIIANIINPSRKENKKGEK